MPQLLFISPQAKQLKKIIADYNTTFNQDLVYASTLEEGIIKAIDLNLKFIAIDLDHFNNKLPDTIVEISQALAIQPKFIALSSTKDFAFKAYEFGFYSYLLKPIKVLDLKKLDLKLKRDFPKKKLSHKLCLQSHKDFHYLDTSEILCLKADNNTTDIFLKDDRVITAYKTLKVFEESLPKNFIRVHRSYIINKDYISRINFGKQCCSLSHAVFKIPFSKGFKNIINQVNEQLSGYALSGLN